VIKPFIDVEKEQTAPFFYSNTAVFVDVSVKILIALGAGYPSYATDCG